MFKPEKNPLISTGPKISEAPGPSRFPKDIESVRRSCGGRTVTGAAYGGFPASGSLFDLCRCNDISSLFLQVDFPFFIHARFYMRSRSEKLPHKDCRQQDPKDRNPPLFIEGKTIPFCRETERKKSFFHKSPFYLHHRL